MNSLARTVAVTAAVCAATVTAIADSFDSPAAFQAAVTGTLLTEDFDALPVGTEVAVLPCLGLVFEDPGSGFPEIIAGLGSVPSSPPNSLANRPVNIASTQPIRFARVDGALIAAVGLFNPTSDDNLVLRLLDAQGNTIESTIIPPQPAPTFGGIVSAIGGASVELAWDGIVGNGLHGLDDLQIALSAAGVPDVDDDGVADEVDNCALVPNPGQIDADGDGFGNLCDADFNNDCGVDTVDLGIFRQNFFSTDPVADLNGDGVVNPIDLGLMRALFFATPGPACLAVCQNN